MSIERTPLANLEYRAKTGEVSNPAAVVRDRMSAASDVSTKRSLRQRLSKVLSYIQDDCDCDECVQNWEELG